MGNNNTPLLPKSTLEYIQRTDAIANGERNNSLLDAACQLRDARFTQAQALDRLNPCAVGRDGLSLDEAKATIASAYRRQPREPLTATGNTHQHHLEPVSFLPSFVRPEAPEIPLPEPMPDAFASYLKAMFQPGELVNIVTEAKQDKDCKWNPSGHGKTTRLETLLTLGPPAVDAKPEPGVWVRQNPTSGKGSSDKDVTAFRHALIESDKVSLEQQYGMLITSGVPLSAIVKSGKRSVHGLVRVDAADADQYKERVEFLYEYFGRAIGKGLDAQNKNAARLTRLPGFMRSGAAQELLAVNVGMASFADWQEEVTTPRAIPLGKLKLPSPDDAEELLKRRFLSRGGGALLVGPTGIGKSSLAMQCMILWALGREAFGIQPARPLKSLLIQAENDEGDLAEMRNGVMNGMALTFEEGRQAMDNVIISCEDSAAGASFCQGIARPLLKRHKPDLLWIDPALSYLGGDASSQKDVGPFLRNQVNPLLREFRCGGIIVTHTGKPSKDKDKGSYAGSDTAYQALGSVEWANWARAILGIEATGTHTVFRLRACKRGPRLTWTESDGITKAYTRLIAHSDEPGIICWRDADEKELPATATNKAKTPDDVLPHVPTDKPIPKLTLKSKCNNAGIALNKFQHLLAELLEDGRLYEWKIKRPGTNPLIQIARAPQPEGEL